MDIKDLEQNGIEITIGNKAIKVKGRFVGNFFCVDRRSIDISPSLTEREKDDLKRQLLSDKNILLSEQTID